MMDENNENQGTEGVSIEGGMPDAPKMPEASQTAGGSLKDDETAAFGLEAAKKPVEGLGLDTADEYALGAEAVAEVAEEEKKKKKGSEALEWIRDILIAVVLAVIISQFITPTIVQEHSMDSTLNNNDYLILWKMAYKFGNEPDYGDIVVFKSELLNEQGDKKLLIKRVIAKPGDTVAVYDGVVYRNGEALDEPYTKDGYTNGGIDETVVPDGELFLLGDNRVVSVDSRSPEVGFVEESRLVGKAVLRLYPFSEFGGLYSNYPEA